MTSRPRIFISAVSKELRSARQLVANALHFLGYEPVWQEIFGMEEGDLREMLRKKVAACQGVVQIVGQCYGAEPPAPDEAFGRTSYTQYEALHARLCGKKVWFLVLDENFPSDPHEAEPEALRQLQRDYRQRVQTDKHLFQTLGTREALEANILKLKDELGRLRRTAKLAVAALATLLVLTLALVVWVLITVRQPSADVVTDARAHAALVAKNYPAAFEAYVRLSDLAPANLSYHRHVEEAARLGRLQQAFLERYLALVQRQPANAIFHNYLGNACLLLDPRDADGKAQAHYEIASRLDPQCKLPLANLGILAFRAGKTNAAQALFQSYLAAYPDDAQGWVNLGMLYTAQLSGNTPEPLVVQQAERAMRRALRIEPGLASAYKGLGRILAASGRKADALNAYQRSLALNDAQPDVRRQVEQLAWSAAGVNPPGLPADDLQTRSPKGAVSPAPPVVAALRLLDQQRYPEATRVCLEWCQREPENPLACQLLARAYAGVGQPAAARKAQAAAQRLSTAPSSAP